MKNQIAYVTIIRPANLVTSVADVLAGVAISGYFLTTAFDFEHLAPILLLCISTLGLYSGGVIFNDVFDAEKDKKERPGRPIPSGAISQKDAAVFGGICFTVGIVAAAAVNLTSLVLALLILTAALTYDKWSKHLTVMGPVNMGLCRGLNLLLGVSIFSRSPEIWWLVIAIIPIVYIAALTIINRRKGDDKSKTTLYLAAFLYAFVIACILFIANSKGYFLLTILFVIPFYLMIFTPLFKALDNPTGENINKSVKAGVIALILLNAAWASAFGIWYIALIILLLLPLSLWLSKKFTVN
ncbi:UbiA-like protein EboC [Pedobacter sp. PLR]|uniref:UbiA-like protein EboC n=1 Tax=Pedobacter sp. PLR TaxID=2994465 RepID=UPI0022473250|nr:UbiA-like protein EboC [Pedobacter sp. PLR]MCX2450625.1 UbiA-like protein EboC [Pedobacter sp. PLR]